jgi:hypothetical protein
LAFLERALGRGTIVMGHVNLLAVHELDAQGTLTLPLSGEGT